MNAIEQLSASTETALAFLREQKLLLEERRGLFPESFKGGFMLTFAGDGRKLTVEYLDMQFEVRAGNVELFGPTTHPAFAGNMFSREHLIGYLPRLVLVLRSQLARHTWGAA